MKEEVRKAIGQLREFMSECDGDIKKQPEKLIANITLGNYHKWHYTIEESIATIERALTDTTLEIVKRKREKYRKSIHLANGFDRNWIPRLIDTLEEIITESESTK